MVSAREINIISESDQKYRRCTDAGQNEDDVESQIAKELVRGTPVFC
jgi:hypothetical protein